jgi:hypothetical protein
VAGLAVELSADDERRGAAVASLLRYAPTVAGPPQFRVHFGTQPVALPARDPDRVAHDVRLWRTDHELVVAVAEGLTAHAGRDEIFVRGDVGAAAQALDRAFRRVAVFALGHTLAAFDRHLVHAGALVRDGRGVLVVGETGSGKSTLALAALTAGWEVVSDDLVVLTAGPDGSAPLVQVAGLPRPICVSADLVDLGVPDGEVFGAQPVVGDPRGRVELGAGTLHGGAAVIAGVVVTAGDESGGSLAPLPGQDVLLHVLRSTVSFEDPARRGDVLSLAAAVSRAPGWRLWHAVDTATRVEVAGRLLDEVAGRLVTAGHDE